MSNASDITRQAVFDVTRMFEDVLRRDMKSKAEDAERHPERYRDSLIFNGGPRYRYFEAPAKAKGWKLHFCHSTNRNIGGRFLSWTEAIKGGTVKRVGILSHDTRKAAKERSLWKLREMRKPAADRAFKPNL